MATKKAETIHRTLLAMDTENLTINTFTTQLPHKQLTSVYFS